MLCMALWYQKATCLSCAALVNHMTKAWIGPGHNVVGRTGRTTHLASTLHSIALPLLIIITLLSSTIKTYKNYKTDIHGKVATLYSQLLMFGLSSLLHKHCCFIQATQLCFTAIGFQGVSCKTIIDCACYHELMVDMSTLVEEELQPEKKKKTVGSVQNCILWTSQVQRIKCNFVHTCLHDLNF